MDIRELRDKRHLTQQQFADIVGVSISSVQKWESNVNPPSALAVNLIKTRLEDYDG
jgi:DNA-binding transcriptional regulator YiaG